MPGLTQGNEDNLIAAIDAEEQKMGTPPQETPAPVIPADDPEVDLGEEKVKRSQILEWKKGNMLQSDYTQKTQALTQQRKELDELVRFADYLKANPQKLQKVLAALEDKVDVAENKQEAIATELEGLDPNDPYAKMLKQQLTAIKAELKPLQEKLTQFEQRDKEVQQKTLVQQAQQVLSSTLDETFKALKFDDEQEKSVCKQMVLSYLKDNPKDYADENDFKNTISEISKKQFDALQKIGEAKVRKYLESKKAIIPPPATGAQGQLLTKKPTFANMEDIIQSELQRESV